MNVRAFFRTSVLKEKSKYRTRARFGAKSVFKCAFEKKRKRFCGKRAFSMNKKQEKINYFSKTCPILSFGFVYIYEGREKPDERRYLAFRN